MEYIGKLIAYINRVNQKGLAKGLKDIGLGSGGHHSCLITVLNCPGLTQEQVTGEVKFDKATTARSVKQLEEAGLIERKVDEKDRRSYRLYPTPQARELEPRLFAVLGETNRKLTQHLSDEEREQLNMLLQKLYDSIKNEADY